MIEKTPAIVLRLFPFSETSQVVSWLTPEHGQILTIVKGSKRPRSAFLGQFDLFYTCELLFYTGGTSGVHIARECSPLDSRPALRKDWRAAMCASSICCMSRRAAAAEHSESGLYELTEICLNALSCGEPSALLLFWYEIQLSRLLGVSPHFSTCISCGSRPSPTDTTFFAARRGGLICADCEYRAGVELDRMSPSCRSSLLRMQSARNPSALRTLRITPEQLLAFRLIMDKFIQFHAGISTDCRGMALQLLDSYARPRRVEAQTKEGST